MQSMKNDGMVKDARDNTALIFGNKIALPCTKLGHYTLPICLPVDEKRVDEMFICTGGPNGKEVENLHKQLAYLSAKKLKMFLRTAG